MLNDCGKELLKPWVSVQNLVLIGSMMFMIALFKPSSSELASWVQAVGSIAAIWGALYVSRSEQKKREEVELKEKQGRIEQIREIFKKVARSQKIHLNHLCGVLIEARMRDSDQPLKDYFALGLNLHWTPNLESLGQFSITDLATAKIEMINELKVGGEFARLTCEKLMSRPHDGELLKSVIEQMRHHEMMAITALERAKTQEKGC
ncbi:hypothetical protein QLG25_14110 [Pseudomonas sp. CBR-F]